MLLFLCFLFCYSEFALCDVVEQEGKRCKVACGCVYLHLNGKCNRDRLCFVSSISIFLGLPCAVRMSFRVTYTFNIIDTQ